jgi:CBS domain-containing protein
VPTRKPASGCRAPRRLCLWLCQRLQLGAAPAEQELCGEDLEQVGIGCGEGLPVHDQHPARRDLGRELRRVRVLWQRAARAGHRLPAVPVAGQDAHRVQVEGGSQLGDQFGDGLVRLSELMTTPPATVGPDDRVTDAARLMYARGVRQLPVVDQTGHLAGLVSRADVLSVYTRPDEKIRRQITDGVLRDDFRADPARFKVTVTDGIVTLEGHAASIAAASGIVAEIRRLDGVVAVCDRLTWRVQDPESMGS